MSWKNLFKLLFVSFLRVENQGSNTSCDSRIHAYKNGKTMEQCRQEARKTTELLSKEVSKIGEVSWKRVLEVTDYDELVYKLTLKYLRQKGYDIGNNTLPRIMDSRT
jgi:hypothetical protein